MNDKTHNCMCMLCKEVKATQSVMSNHLRTKHKQKMKIGKNWEWTEKPATKQKQKNGKRKYSKRKPTATTQQYIDIQAIIRIPIAIGRVQILARE